MSPGSLGQRGATSASGSPPDHSLATRLAWITGLRLGFLALLLSATTTLYLRGELARYPFSLHVVFVTIATGFALAAVYAAALRMGKRLQALAWAQIALDQVTWTAIVYVTGGATSGATSFYALTCLLGAILVGLRGAAGGGGSRHRDLCGCSVRVSASGGCCRRSTSRRARTPSRRRRSSIRCSSTRSA